jgi:hypothetical protein
MLKSYQTLKKVAYRSGVVMVLFALILILALVTGMLYQTGIIAEEAQLLPGESLIHTFVRLVVLGCMLCALGSLE